tara:strand:- start:90 stop:491 length:402 start_codon:yes stop_codon:yes gene_type:complete
MEESRKEEIREYYKQIKNHFFKETINAISRDINQVIIIIKKDANKRKQPNKLVEEILRELIDYANLNLEKWENNDLLSKDPFIRNRLGFKIKDRSLFEDQKQVREQLKKAKIIHEKIELQVSPNLTPLHNKVK